MKKTGSLFLLIIIAILIVNIIPVYAAIDPSNSNDPLGIGINPDSIPQNPNELKDVSATYLKQEWTKILEKTQTGRALLKVSDFLTSLNFFWKPVLGIEYSLSWIFIFAVTIWFILFYLVYGPLYAFFSKRIMAIIVAFAVTSLIGTAGVIKRAVVLLSTIINNTWIAWISFIVAVILIWIIIYLSGGLKTYISKQKEAEEKRKTEEAQEVIQIQGKVSKKELESY
jgi:hypothetical protein